MFFRKKPRRPRGPHTPQATELNWQVFLTESEEFRQLGIPAAAWAGQDVFEKFLATGTGWRATTPEDVSRLRDLVWRYRERTKRGYGQCFIEHEDGPSRYAEVALLAILETSDRWGTNEQPLDADAFAKTLASLPVYSAEMRSPATLVLRFLRPLTDEEARRLVEASNTAESPFLPDSPKLAAFLWWS